MPESGYRVRGRTAATAATAGHCVAALWNAHSTKRIQVMEFSVFKTTAGTAGDALMLQRITARGTAGSTATPVLANADQRDIAPPFGPLLDLAAYSAQPTVEAPGMFAWVAPVIAAAGIVYPTGSIEVPPGMGLAITQVAATAWPISEVAFRWQE